MNLRKFSRRHFVLAAGIAKVALGAGAERPPNFVFVLTDDQGYGDLACLGNPIVKTPNLDHLYSQSLRLTDFHVSPTCAPTRTALMTGRHEFRSGVTHTILERERMSLRSTTIAQVLKSAGYTNGIFGKWHLGDSEAYQPGKRGFDEVFIHGCGGVGQDYPGTCSDVPGNTYFDPTVSHNGVFERTKGFCTDVFFTQALKWIEQTRSSPIPFFAFITPNAPHAPLLCPEEYQRMYKGLNLGENTEKYFGMVTNIDDNVGRLIGRLNNWGLDRNTVVVFMTDNGGTSGVQLFNAGMRGAKGTAYSGGTRVPAFVRWTGTIEPVDASQLASHIDIFPTFAELAGAKIPAGLKLDGKSLVSVLKNSKTAWPDRYLFTHVGRWPAGKAAESKYLRCSVRTARYNLVSPGPLKKWELYDLSVDPGEKHDIASANPEVVARIDAEYDKWWASILPTLENETSIPPRVAPYKERYWKQYGGGPGVLPANLQ